MKKVAFVVLVVLTSACAGSQPKTPACPTCPGLDAQLRDRSAYACFDRSGAFVWKSDKELSVDDIMHLAGWVLEKDKK